MHVTHLTLSVQYRHMVVCYPVFSCLSSLVPRLISHLVSSPRRPSPVSPPVSSRRLVSRLPCSAVVWAVGGAASGAVGRMSPPRGWQTAGAEPAKPPAAPPRSIGRVWPGPTAPPPSSPPGSGRQTSPAPWLLACWARRSRSPRSCRCLAARC